MEEDKNTRELLLGHVSLGVVRGLLLLAGSLVTILAINACTFSNRLYVQDVLQSIREIRGAQVTYFSQMGRYGTLTELAGNQLIDKEISDGQQSHYSFVLEISASAYTLEVYPDSDVGSCFFMDETGVIRASFYWQTRSDRNSEAIQKQ